MQIELYKERLREQYAPLIEQFTKDIQGLNVTGIPAPHIPIMGKYYSLAKYKIAFVGIETYDWTDINEFCKTAIKDSGKAVFFEENTINNLEHLGWATNYHATFWGFVFKFLAQFYKVDFNDLVNGKKYPELLKSFVWGNTNSIERYHVSAKDRNVNYETWERVKKASIRFDSINNLTKSVAPKLFFIMNSQLDKDYIYNDDEIRCYGVPVENKKSVMKLTIDENMKMFYYFLRDENIHIIVLPHPRWMGTYSGYGIEAYVNKVISIIQKYSIWNSIPDKMEDWKGDSGMIDKSSIEFKRSFIADLATVLMNNNLVMSGKELQLLLNINNIKSQYGTPYSKNGGRGVHNLITQVWKHYYKKKDYQMAYNISRAFVNQNGEYAWI